MVRGLTIAVLCCALLCAVGVGTADACHRGGGCYASCYTPCYSYCCYPCSCDCCYPCHQHCTWCWGAYWDCCKCQWVWVYVHCNCGLHNIPGWCYGYIPDYCRYGCVYVYRCYYDEKSSTPPGVAPAPTEKKAAANVEADGRATLVVELPENAVLTVDDQATASTSTHRNFVTPQLPAGTDYRYTLKATFSVDGSQKTVEKVVTVRAGQETKVNMLATDAVAAK